MNWKPVTIDIPNKRVLTFSPSYPVGDTMRFRLMDGQFVKICKEVTLWCSEDDLEPVTNSGGMIMKLLSESEILNLKKGDRIKIGDVETSVDCWCHGQCFYTEDWFTDSYGAPSTCYGICMGADQCDLGKLPVFLIEVHS
jgi:hypothetical protein